jgi:hypothetical protein
MNRETIHISLLALSIVVNTFPPSAESAPDSYEVAVGGGTNLDLLATTESVLLWAWTKSLSPMFDLRIEPNLEVIGTTSGQSVLFGGVSPVLRIVGHGHVLNPFLDAGVGVSVSTTDTLLYKNFGNYFFFSPTAGVGVTFGRSAAGPSFFVRWLHHSNAGLFPPNQGIDSLYVFLGCRL